MFIFIPHAPFNVSFQEIYQFPTAEGHARKSVRSDDIEWGMGERMKKNTVTDCEVLGHKSIDDIDTNYIF